VAGLDRLDRRSAARQDGARLHLAVSDGDIVCGRQKDGAGGWQGIDPEGFGMTLNAAG
jgi:hypothetical protein